MFPATLNAEDVVPAREALHPFDLRQPCGCALSVEAGLKALRTDGGNTPIAVTLERCTQLLLTDRVRTTAISRSDVTETEQVEVPPRLVTDARLVA